MALQRNPNDPYQIDPADRDLNLRPAARLDEDLRVDPELAEGPTSGGRIAAFAVAIVVVLGVVFYGLNMSSTTPNATPTASQNAPANQTAAQSSTPSVPPAVPPGVRDVTPYNTQPGTTTGAAPIRPVTPPASAPTGTEIDRSTTGGQPNK